MQQRKDLLNKVEGLIEAHINEIIRLMAKNHFEQFFFDEYQPTTLLPMRPFVTASYFEGKESVSKTIFLRSHARISQIVHGNVYGDCQYTERLFYIDVAISEINMKHFPGSVAIKPNFADVPYKDDDYLKQHIKTDKAGYIDIKSCQFQIDTLENIVIALYDMLPKI